MGLNLDLESCYAKIARARTHMHSLNGEIAAFVEKQSPYSARVTDIDPKSGVCSVFLRVSDFKEHSFGIIFGDAIHNLRSTLNYIVSELVFASGAKLSSKHQFPVFTVQSDYIANVGTRTIPSPGKMLTDVKFGIEEIWEVQPFNSDPNPFDSLLFFLNHFSNADKHRIVASRLPYVGSASFQLNFGSGRIIERYDFPPFINPQVSGEYEVVRVRFGEPYPPKPECKIDLNLSITFATPAFGQVTDTIAINIGVLEKMCDRVAMIADCFKAL